MTSQLKHCDDGPTPEEDSTQLQTYKESSETTNKCNSRKRQRSATLPESVQNINETILNDKSKISDSTIQNTKSSATLIQGSTGNAGVLPFWNGYIQEESRKWWLPERF